MSDQSTGMDEKRNLQVQVHLLQGQLVEKNLEIKNLKSKLLASESREKDLKQRLQRLNQRAFSALGDSDSEYDVDNAEEVSKALSRFPILVDRLERMIPEKTNDTERPMSIKIPDNEEEKWAYFSSQVKFVEAKAKLEFKFSLIHHEGESNVYDLATENLNPRYEKGVFLVSNDVQITAKQTSKTISQYVTTLLPDYFKVSTAVFCTCFGTAKGQKSGAHPRAALPKLPRSVLIDHCMQVFQNDAINSTATKSELQRAINRYLHGLRVEHNLVEPSLTACITGKRALE